MAAICLTQPATAPTLYITFYFLSVAVAGTVWQQGWTLPSDGSVTEAELAADDPPTGADMTVDLVVDGTPAANVATLAAAATYQQTVYGTPIAGLAGDVVHPKFITAGATNPGQQVQMRIKFVPS